MATNKKGYTTSVYVKTENGKKIKKSVYGKTIKERNQKAKALKREIEKGKDLSLSGNFGVWCDKWFEEVKKPAGLSTGTIIEYKSAIKHLKCWFGDCDFKNITLSMFQHEINNLAECNPNTNKPASKKLLCDIKKVAKNVFKYAKLNKVPYVNEFIDAVTIPKTAVVTKKYALSFEEQQMIIETPHRAQIAAMIMMFAGLRRGELIALRWRDIDLENACISIKCTADLQKNQPIIKDCGKSENAIRTVYIPPILIDYLKKHKSDADSFVLQKVTGGPMSKSAFVKMWDSYWLDLNVKYGFQNRDVSKFDPKGLPEIIKKRNAHECRHTFATIMYLQGIDLITAKELIGHSDIQLLVKIYTDSKDFNPFTISESYQKMLKNEYKIPVKMLKVPEKVPETA